MNIYLLRPKGYDEGGIAWREGTYWDPWYDKVFGFVVIAETPKKARDLATVKDCRGPWLDTQQTTCVKLGETNGPERMVIRDMWSA